MSWGVRLEAKVSPMFTAMRPTHFQGLLLFFVLICFVFEAIQSEIIPTLHRQVCRGQFDLPVSKNGPNYLQCTCTLCRESRLVAK